MHSDHDFDAIFLLAMSLAAKRRPAELIDVVAAFDLVSGKIPLAARFVEAFDRLAQFGLICEQDGGYALMPYALNILSGQKKSATHEARILAIKQNLAECRIKKEHVLIELKLEPIALAIRTHRASKDDSIRNLNLKPKSEPGVDKRPARRKSNQAFAARQRKG